MIQIKAAFEGDCEINVSSSHNLTFSHLFTLEFKFSNQIYLNNADSDSSKLRRPAVFHQPRHQKSGKTYVSSVTLWLPCDVLVRHNVPAQ